MTPRLNRILEAARRGMGALEFKPELPVKAYWHPVIGDAVIRLFEQEAQMMLGEMESFQHRSYLMKIEDGTYAGSYRRVVESHNPAWRQGETALSKERARSALLRIMEGTDNGSKADASLRFDIYEKLTIGREADGNLPFNPPVLIAQWAFGVKGYRFEEPEEPDYNTPFTGQF